MRIRQRIFEIIEVSDGSDRASSLYDAAMIAIICASLVPLAFKEDSSLLQAVDTATVSVFIVDYLLRWLTADKKLGGRPLRAFLRYPLTPFALIDLVSILPSMTIINSGFRLFRLFRMARALRVLRVFKALRYSRSFQIIAAVLRRSSEPLIAVCTLAVAYIFIAALIIFNVEAESFETFFDAIYWATVSLTTMGYGDIYPVTTVGRIVTMVSSFFGIAIVALPAGIITAGSMEAIAKGDDLQSSERVDET